MLTLPILLKPRYLSVKNSLTKSRHRLSFIILIIMGLVGIPYSTFQMIVEFRQVVNSDQTLLSVVELLLVTFFSVQFLSSAIHSLQSLYLSRDTELILASPISKLRIFISKYIENVFASSWILILLIFPICFGIIHSRISLAGSICLILCLILAILTISALGLTTTVILSRLYPARSLKELFLLCAIALVVVLHQYGQSNAIFLPQFKDGKFEHIQSSIETWQKKISEQSKGIITYPLKQELNIPSFESRSNSIFLFISLLIISLLAAFRIFTDFYSPSDILDKWQTKQRSRNGYWLRIANSRLISFLQKDLHLFLRDLAQPVQLILFLAIGGITLLSLKQTEQFKMFLTGDTAWWEPFITTIVILCHLLFTVLFCGRFVFPALALEDESDWLLKQSPITPVTFVKLKYFSLLSLTLIILLPTYLALAFATNISVPTIIQGMIFSTIHITTVTACAIGTGGTLPLFRFEHLGQITSGIGSFIFMLSSLLIIPILIGLSFVVAVFTNAVLSKAGYPTITDYIFLLIYSILSYLVIVWFLKQASKRWSI